MTGPWQREGSGIYYFRKATPSDLSGNRLRLKEIGIHVPKEFFWSLRTHDRKEAERRYHEKASKADSIWTSWRHLLVSLPTDLTRKNVLALASEDAQAFVLGNEDNPHLAKMPKLIWQATFENLRQHYAGRSLREGQIVFELGQELQLVKPLDLPSTIVELMKGERDGPRKHLLEEVAKALVSYREAIGWMSANSIAQTNGIQLTKSGKSELAKSVANYRERAWKTLRDYYNGDYRSPDWMQGRPEYVPQGSTSASTVSGEGLSLFYLLERKNKVKLLRPNTLRDWKSKLQAFTKFVGHDDARKVTKQNVIDWRDKLALEGLKPKTINDKYIAALHSMLEHGHKDYGLAENAANVTRLHDSRKARGGTDKGYSKTEAQTILKATIKGATRDLSEPHKRAIKWIPWLMAFTGLRVTEIAQFCGRHLKKEDEVWIMEIRPEDGSTKSGKWWRVPLHSQLVSLGIVEMFHAVGDGPAFYNPYDEGTDLEALEKSHRASEVGDRLAEWVKELGIKAPLGRPNHAWRHRFTTLCRDHMVNSAARNFMLGTLPKEDSALREAYGTWTPKALSREIEKLPPIDFGQDTIKGGT